jgi:diguanylate cyclase (GGDEF)-like protein/PAS domain S-box-containing protein
MHNASQFARKPHKRRLLNKGLAVLRCPLLRILFIHGEPADVRRCLHELKRANLRVRADTVSTLEQFTKQLSAKSYDLIVAEYPSALKWKGQGPKLFQKDGKFAPVILLTGALSPETVADLTRKGAAECIQKENIGHLPVVIRRVLNEETLRGQRDRAEEKLRHSEAHYRALVGNLTYGIFHCTLKGKLLDANPALMTMLGCTRKEELVAANLTNEIISDPFKRQRLLGCPEDLERSDALEMDWKRRDGRSLKVRLSGREVIGADQTSSGYEIIAEDVTKQRELEDHLRQQAAKDSLTGLANYRSLVSTLDREIKRSQRTGREFALLLFDLDDLKKINDRYGHLVGSQALCRLADCLSMGCRDIDTAARFGGDEFALVLPETCPQSASLVSQRICSNFANYSGDPKLSVSVGVATYPKDGESIETLLAAADAALYAMKAWVHGKDDGGSSDRMISGGRSLNRDSANASGAES